MSAHFSKGEVTGAGVTGLGCMGSRSVIVVPLPRPALLAVTSPPWSLADFSILPKRTGLTESLLEETLHQRKSNAKPAVLASRATIYLAKAAEKPRCSVLRILV
jgi:hypothetical protein